MNRDPAGQTDRGWRWLWIGTALAVLALLFPVGLDYYRLSNARKEGDLPRALSAARSLTEGFFGPLLAPWLDEVSKEIQSEVVEDNLMSIKRLVPDSEESAYAELELGRLALGQGDARQAALHFERYLKSGLGRDVPRAKMDLSEAYRELKRYDESAKLLQEVLKALTGPANRGDEARMEASFRLGELYQFYLNRSPEALDIYRRAVEDTAAPGRWRNDILTNLALLKE